MSKSSVLVLCAGSLGDAILTLPALNALQSRADVTVAGTLPYQALGAPLLGVHEVGPMDALLQALYAGPLEEADKVFLAGFQDIFVFFKEKDDSLLEKLASVGGPKVNFPPKPFKEFLKEGRWAADYWLQAVLGDPLPEDCPWRQARLNLDGALRKRGGQILQSLGLSAPLIIHPGSGSPSKNAPLSFFRTAAERTAAESGRNVLVVWGEAEQKDLPAIREAFAGLKGVGVVPESLSLPDLAAVFSQSSAYLGNDSGVTQLASACGLRTFAVFNSTDARVWGPQANSIILSALKGNLH